jgi:hypothetical protein
MFTGEMTIRASNDADTYIITRKRKAEYAIEVPHIVMGEDQLIPVLSNYVEKKGTKDCNIETLIIQRATKNNTRTVTIRSLSRGGLKAEINLLPDRGYAVQRMRAYLGESKLFDRETVEWHDRGGISYPARGHQISYMHGNRVGERIDFELESIETSAANIPDSLFQFEFPPNAKIWDEDLQIYVRRSEQIQTHLDEIIQRAGPRSLWRAWFWPVAIGSATLVGLAAGFWYRRRNRAK